MSFALPEEGCRHNANPADSRVFTAKRLQKIEQKYVRWNRFFKLHRLILVLPPTLSKLEEIITASFSPFGRRTSNIPHNTLSLCSEEHDRVWLNFDTNNWRMSNVDLTMYLWLYPQRGICRHMKTTFSYFSVRSWQKWKLLLARARESKRLEVASYCTYRRFNLQGARRTMGVWLVDSLQYLHYTIRTSDVYRGVPLWYICNLQSISGYMKTLLLLIFSGAVAEEAKIKEVGIAFEIEIEKSE